ncbi:MAG TPA: xanthine dehydrogenase accessory protein XdhC [Terriglobales bacterium]|nr:xanthine dehydrogenase accessory protein XdhC [Terriglobales bacterium]
MLIWASLLRAVERAENAALVSVVRVFGSTPREAGARMVVTADDVIGTIGGGNLEWEAMQLARSRLAAVTHANDPLHQVQILGPDLGQCCGGRIEIVTEVFRQTDRARITAMAEREAAGKFMLTGRIVAPDFIEHFGERRGRLYLFGAGHVGRAVIAALAPLTETSLVAAALPLDITWVDSRADCFDGLALPSTVTAVVADDPAAVMTAAEQGSFVLIMTHSHALDYDLTAAALRQPDLAYVGLIGSATKRARFLHRLREERIDPARIDALVCPVGLTTIRSKHPAAIAAAIAAQLLIRAEEVRATGSTDGSVISFHQKVRDRAG